MLRVVVDTSSLVSYALTRGELMRRVVEHWRAGTFLLLSSPEVRAELAAVLVRPRIKTLSVVPLSELVTGLEHFSTHVAGEVSAAGAGRDPNDDKFLACAIEGQAHYLVTSDRDLLDMHDYDGVAIVNPGQFLLARELHELEPAQIADRFDQGVLGEILATVPLDPATYRTVEAIIKGNV